MSLQALHDEIANQVASGCGSVHVFEAMSRAGLPATAADRALAVAQLMVREGELSVAAVSGLVLTADDVFLKGTADVLQMTSVPLQITVTAAGALRVVVMPAPGWTFADSFPLTNGSGATQAGLLNPTFILTTLDRDSVEWTDSAGAVNPIPLTRGLNFAASLKPNGLLGVLGDVLSGSVDGLTVPVRGQLDVSPLAEAKSSPMMYIAGPLCNSIKSLDYFGFGVPQLVVRNFPENPGGRPFLMLAAPLLRGGRPLFTVIMAVQPGSRTITFGGWPEQGGGLSLADICDLAAGTDITGHLPDYLADAFSSVGLKDFQLRLSIPAMRVLLLSVGVGALKPWHLGPFTVDDLRLGLTLRDPFGPRKQASVTFTAALAMFPEVFRGKFELEISAATDGEWSIGAAFVGNVSFNDVVAGISNKAVILPAEVAEITFHDFGVSFQRAGQAWNWELYASADAKFQLPLIGGRVEASLRARVSCRGGAYGFQLGGTLQIGECLFSIDADMGAQRKVLTGKWAMRDGVTLGIADLAAAVNLPPPPIPPELDLALVEAMLEYDFTDKVFLVTATSKTYGKAVFIADASGTALFAFGVELKLGLKLANLPLVGDELPFAENLGIDTASIWVLSRELHESDIATVNELLSGPDVAYPAPLPPNSAGARLILGGNFMLGPDKNLALSVPLASGGQHRVVDAHRAAPAVALLPAAAPDPQQDGGGSVTWIDVQRQFGIFQFNRIGIGYSGGILTFALDAGVTLGPFSLSMDGLSVGSPLTRFDPKFDLNGLGMSFDQAPVSISGALLKVPEARLAHDVVFQFDGSVSVQVQEIGLAALGSYAQMKSGAPSLFLFAQLMMPLGGPPAFFVTGLMGGLGFNRTLALPGLDEVQGFPLLILGKPPAPGQPAVKQDPMKVLRILEGEEAAAPGLPSHPWIVPHAGSFWLAAGLSFTSFELLDTRALVVLQPTDTFTLALLGLSSIQLPVPAENTPTIAYAELQLRAVFQPTLGEFSASAVLSSTSYLLTPDCHLTGGFAFSLWYPPSRYSGDFVMTLGGYHPIFKVPDHYPRVPRLGFNWAVSDTVSIKGTAYCALTPSCVMVGGGLEILFEEGGLKAWFTAQADFLASWRPFFYVAKIDVDIGVSYRLGAGICHSALQLSLGASLDMWGPPTGGQVHVHLVVISFSVSFGAGASTARTEPLDWNGMAALLPDHGSLCTIVAGPQLTKSVDCATSSSRQRWIVRPRGFSFATRSALPASALTCEGGARHGVTAEPISIRPMNKSGIDSTHKIKISRDAPQNPGIDLGNWQCSPNRQSMPSALWGAPPQPFSQIPRSPGNDTVDAMLTGYLVTAPPPALGAKVGPVARAVVAETYLSPSGRAPLSPHAVPDATYVPSVSTATVARIAECASVAARDARAALIAALSGSGIYAGTAGDFSGMAAQAAHLFTEVPMQQAG